jgi:hypothetical protein
MSKVRLKHYQLPPSPAWFYDNFRPPKSGIGRSRPDGLFSAVQHSTNQDSNSSQSQAIQSMGTRGILSQVRSLALSKCTDQEAK